MKQLVFVEYNPALIDDFFSVRELGMNIVYIGLNASLGESANTWIQRDPVRDIAAIIENDLEKLDDVIGVYAVYEHTKFGQQVIAEHFGINHLSREQFNYGRDKHLMRHALSGAGLRCPRFEFLADAESNPQWTLQYPFILKPNLGFASGGVQLVRDEAEARTALRTVRGLNRFVLKGQCSSTLGALAEEYIPGREISVDSLTADGLTRSFCYCRKGFPDDSNFQDFIYSTAVEPDAKQIEREISNALSAFGYSNGPSHAELRWDERTRQWVIIEIAFRVGFGGHIGAMYEEVSGLPYNSLAIRSAIGLLSQSELGSLSGYFNRSGLLFTPAGGQGGIVQNITGQEWLSQDPRIRFYKFEKQIGDAVVAYPKGVEYLGVVMGVAESSDQIEALGLELAQRVQYQYQEAP